MKLTLFLNRLISIPMKKPDLILSSIIFTSLLSCSVSQTYINQSDIGKGNYELNKIIVLHLGGIYDNRRIIESELTYWLTKYGYNVHPSHRFLESQNLPNKIELGKVINENDFDGVLMTRLENIETRERFENTQQRYSTSPSDPVFYNYLDSYKNQYTTGYNFLELIYIVNTELYTVEEEKLIYKSITETRESDTQDLVVEDFSKSIAKSLNKTNWLKKRNKD